MDHKRIRPEEKVPDDLLTAMVAELHVANHQDSVDHHSQRDYPDRLQIRKDIISLLMNLQRDETDSTTKSILRRLFSSFLNNFFPLFFLFSSKWSKPVQDNNKSPEERYEEAEVAVPPDPDGEGEKHDCDSGDVGEAIEEDHPVHQSVLLHLEHEEDQGIDQQDSEGEGYS